MKVLWHGDAGVHTGFGVVTHAFGERLIAKGHEIHALAVNWRGDPEVDTKMKFWMPNFFQKDDVYGMRRVPELVNRIKPDLFVLYNDLPVAQAILENLWTLPNVPPVLLYFPIDAVNIPNQWMLPIRRSNRSVTFTEWAKTKVLETDPYIPQIDVIPHGVDTDTYFQLSPQRPGKMMLGQNDTIEVTSRHEARSILGVADRFVVLWSDRNSPRKNPAAFFEAMAPLVKKHPDILLWIHCRPQDEGGIIDFWVERHGLQRNVRITPGLDSWIGVPSYHLNALYNAADVRVSTALGEGFGLHGVEAAAARLAQVVPEFTCFPDVIGKGAIYIPGAADYVTPRGVDLSFPSIPHITEAVERLYLNEVERRRLGNEGNKHIQQFNWDKLTDQFEKVMLETVNTPFPAVIGV